MNYNPPYNTSKFTDGIFKGTASDRGKALEKALFEDNESYVRYIMREYGSFILDFYERDTGHKVCPVTVELLRNSWDNMIDFQTIFGWILKDEIPYYRVSYIYGKCAYGEIWRDTCNFIALIVEDRNDFKFTPIADNPSFALHCCLHEGCYHKSYSEFMLNNSENKTEKFCEILEKALDNI